MKVLVNGGVNLWELDGWWAEAYTPEVGWVLGDGQEHRDDSVWDAAEAESLYNILESQVVPELYTRYNIGIPERWIQRMQRSMSTLTPQFSANRTVREYSENYYLPGAVNYLKRATTKGAAAKEIVNEKPEVQNKWNVLIITEVQSAAVENGFPLQLQFF
jgi:starch phosphorylase